MNTIPGFLALESANETPVIGSFKLSTDQNSFDAMFESARNSIMEAYGVDPLTEINAMIKNKTIMEAYKDAMLSGLMSESVADPFDPTQRQSTIGNQIDSLLESISWQVCFTQIIHSLFRLKLCDKQLLPR